MSGLAPRENQFLIYSCWVLDQRAKSSSLQAEIPDPDVDRTDRDSRLLGGGVGCLIFRLEDPQRRSDLHALIRGINCVILVLGLRLSCREECC